MKPKSVDTIVDDVRVCLDEIGANEAELIGGTDEGDMNAVIKSKIADAIRYVYLHAESTLISPKVKTETKESDDKGVVSVVLDDDFLRLSFARMADWDVTATDVIAHTDKRYATLKNPITTGYPDNPKAAIVEKAESSAVKKYLELYSSSTKNGNVECTYGYIANPSLEGESYNIDDRVYRAVVYQTAGFTLQALKDAHAESMFNMALTLMGAK